MKELAKLTTGFERRFFDIPFGNSDFQNRKFIKEAQFTPARAYRALGLRLLDRINALREAKFSFDEIKIDIDELLDRQRSEIGVFELRRIDLNLKRKNAQLHNMEKLVNDAAHEVKFLWSEVESFPEFTRKQFEAGEHEHFLIRFKRNGDAASLDMITNNDKEFDRMLCSSGKTTQAINTK